MTAGRGIAHSEVSTPTTTRLHGVQLWVALPDASRHIGPFFEHAETVPVVDRRRDRASVRRHARRRRRGHRRHRVLAPARRPGRPARRAARRARARPVVRARRARRRGPVAIEVDGADAATEVAWSTSPTSSPAAAARAAAGCDRRARRCSSAACRSARQIVMWWNFIGRSHDEIVDVPAAVAGRRHRARQSRRPVRRGRRLRRGSRCRRPNCRPCG